MDPQDIFFSPTLFICLVLTMSNIQNPADSSLTLAASSQDTLGHVDTAVAEKNTTQVDAEALKNVSSNEESSQDEESHLVHWDGDYDPQNPLNWSPARKWTIIGLISISSFNVYVLEGMIFASIGREKN